jgi:hypothetical protein
MTDVAFSGRWLTTLELVLAMCVELTQHTSRLSMLDAVREMLPYARVVYRNEGERAYLDGHEAGSRYAWQRAGMEGDPPGWEPLDDDLEAEQEDFDPGLEGELDALTTRLEETDIVPELLGRLERKITREAWTLWEAFAGFAEATLGVAAGEALKGPPRARTPRNRRPKGTHGAPRRRARRGVFGGVRDRLLRDVGAPPGENEEALRVATHGGKLPRFLGAPEPTGDALPPLSHARLHQPPNILRHQDRGCAPSCEPAVPDRGCCSAPSRPSAAVSGAPSGSCGASS